MTRTYILTVNSVSTQRFRVKGVESATEAIKVFNENTPDDGLTCPLQTVGKDEVISGDIIAVIPEDWE